LTLNVAVNTGQRDCAACDSFVWCYIHVYWLILAIFPNIQNFTLTVVCWIWSNFKTLDELECWMFWCGQEVLRWFGATAPDAETWSSCAAD